MLTIYRLVNLGVFTPNTTLALGPVKRDADGNAHTDIMRAGMI